MEEFKFDFEDLNVYKKALDFIDAIFMLTKNLPREYRFSIGANLLRAGLSISNPEGIDHPHTFKDGSNNLAEGNDKHSKRERDKYFRISSDSTRECVSVFIVLKRQKLIEDSIYLKLKKDAREITSMIQGLLR